MRAAIGYGAVTGGPREDGLTLVEVASTLFLLTALALSVGLLIVPMARQSRLNREMITARAEVDKVLERVHSTPFNELLQRFPDGVELPVDRLENGRIVVTYEDTAADPLHVKLDLHWKSKDFGNLHRTFHTARTE